MDNITLMENKLGKIKFPGRVEEVYWGKFYTPKKQIEFPRLRLFCNIGNSVRCVRKRGDFYTFQPITVNQTPLFSNITKKQSSH